MIKYQQLQDREWLISEVTSKPLRQVAKEIGCSYSAVVCALRVHKINVVALTKTRRVRRSLLEEQMLPEKDKIILDYISGDRVISEISIKYGVTYFGVRKILKKWGVDMTTQKHPRSLRILESSKEDILKKFKAFRVGYSLASLATTYHVSYKTMRDTLIKWGVMPHTLQHRRVYGKGEEACNWKGGFYGAGKGQKYVYKYANNHPNATKDGYVMEHRLVMEKHIGRYLTKEEIVHHRDGRKDNNVIENLELVSDQGSHTREHFERSHITEQAELEVQQLREELEKAKQLLKENGIIS